MLNDHLQSPVTQQRLRAGLAADHIDGFADWLHDQGYKPISITTILRSFAAWSDWATQAGAAISEAIDALDSCKAFVTRADRPRYSRGPNNHSLSAAALFIRFLQERGVLACPDPVPSPTEVWPVLSDFRAWMQQQGGLRESSLDTYQFVIVEMLEFLGDAVHTYTAAQVRDFVEQCAKPHGLWRAKSITTATRAFLRFLSATGYCTAGLEHAIPSYASWTLSSVPRFLEPEEVERVLAVCVSKDIVGLRDRAVMLLLARLGLRASEVAALTLQDLDWENGWIVLCGKGRRHERLPLPQDVGDAILRYILEGRPALDNDRIFARVNAPMGPLTRAAVTGIARSALRRAGIKAPINGAHVFRHSAATAMLRRGASLAGVGAVLRHRSPSTTAHYAKVDFALLAEVAQPWPGVSPC
jgi:site-specific recombinase XerD